MSQIRTTDVVVVGGGQAGMAASRCLTDAAIDHVVLERGETAHSWRTERWDSLRLLTPNWLTRLPGFRYSGPDPDGYMTAAEVVELLDGYAAGFGAPIRTGAGVERLTPVGDGDGFVLETGDGPWRARSVVVATGACSDPHRPAFAEAVPSHVDQLSPIEYRNPDQIGPGRVLVVGASASGLQIADELLRAGRDVVVSVGEHVRLPRSYRGMDIHWWMDQIGLLDERFDEVEDIAKARRLPSLQLVGSPEGRDLDLGGFLAGGGEVVGRLASIDGHRAWCAGSLPNVVALADLKLGRLLDRLDEHAADHGLDPELGAPSRPERTPVGSPSLEVDLRDVGTIVWATGFRPRYPWIDEALADAVLDRKGQLVHDGGVLPVPGLYALGLPFLRRRKSSFLDGVGPDAIEIVGHLAGRLAGTR